MGYLKKGGTVCNPAKKNTVVFQNSYTIYRKETRYGETAGYNLEAIYGTVVTHVTSNFPSDATATFTGNGVTRTMSIWSPNFGGMGQLIYFVRWNNVPSGWVVISNFALAKLSSAYQVNVPNGTAWNTKWRKLSA